MNSDFKLEILTAGKKLLSETVTEVIIPGHDGEIGILPGHGDFIGKLGTGALKLVKEGKDFWYMVSGGVYEIKEGVLSILAEQAENSSDIVGEEFEALESDIQEKLKELNLESEEGRELRAKLEQNTARLEVQRRTSSVH